MLKEFFELPFDQEISAVAVRKCDPDKFRPLCNFLKKDIMTREKNIELLAWLIDFRPRPYSQYCRLSKGKTDPLSELSITETGIVEGGNNMEPLYRSANNLPEQHNDIGHNTSDRTEGVLSPKDIAHYQDVTVRDGAKRQEVTLEYPSGVKLSVDASNLSLIAALVRL
ncbi:hypothetical protein [Pedobacter sp. MC2016-24]|uniref:hypothetical protein n=1 Tax=Pedobacter sp. MC2016-24 TaxID=2780090 RepID=UPI001881E20F|nr:hypothetical protein [Pedobacter sp. MC2016-24]MBE9598680.1 hypothetical protein [Pedobacter sp. MC2016-24]